MQSFILASVLAGAVSALPAPAGGPGDGATSPGQPTYPTWKQQVFSLTAKLRHAPLADPNSLKVDNWQVGSFRYAPNRNGLILIDPNGSDASKPVTFVQNATAGEEYFYQQGFVNAYPPYANNNEFVLSGITIDDTDDTVGHGVDVDVGSQTPNTGIAYPYVGNVQPDSQPFLSHRKSDGQHYEGVWYVCQEQVTGGLFVPTVNWRDEGATTPPNCAEVQFFPQCAGQVEDQYKGAYKALQDTPCYANADQIPWLREDL